jgi:hypothetical protein
MYTYRVHENYREEELVIFEDHATLRLRVSAARESSILDVHKSRLWIEEIKLKKLLKEDFGEIMCVPSFTRIHPFL